MTETTSTGGDDTQTGAVGPSGAGAAGTPVVPGVPAVPGTPATSGPGTPAETAISDRWARRRLEIYGAMERTLHDGIAQTLKTVVDVRAEVEQDVETFLAGLAAERARRQAELDDLGAQREGAEARLVARRQQIDDELAARRRDQEQAIEARRREQEADLEARRAELEDELRALRQGAEEEVATLRSTTQAEIERMVQEAETRRAQVAAEVRTLEQQVAQIQGVIDSFLDNQLQTLRGSLGSSRARQGEARGGVSAGGGGSGGAGGSGNGGEPAQGGESAGGGDEGGPGSPTEGWPPADATGAALGSLAGQRTSLVISGVPHFSRARALWQAIQDLPGVAEAKTISYQGGTLSMEVQHDPTLDLSASVVDLPGLRLRVAEASPGQLRLAAEV